MHLHTKFGNRISKNIGDTLYAPDSMQFLETRSGVKFKDTVTQLLYETLCHPKMHPHNKSEIPTTNNKRYAPDTIIHKNYVRGQGHSDPKMVCGTPPSKDASTHQIWNSYLKEFKRYAPDTIILETRSEVKVTVTRKLYMTLRHLKMHPHTKFEIPTSNNIRDMLRTQFFLKLAQRSD